MLTKIRVNIYYVCNRLTQTVIKIKRVKFLLIDFWHDLTLLYCVLSTNNTKIVFGSLPNNIYKDDKHKPTNLLYLISFIDTFWVWNIIRLRWIVMMNILYSIEMIKKNAFPYTSGWYIMYYFDRRLLRFFLFFSSWKNRILFKFMINFLLIFLTKQEMKEENVFFCMRRLSICWILTYELFLWKKSTLTINSILILIMNKY